MHTLPNDAIHLAAQTGDLAQMQALYEADPSVLSRIHSLYDTSPLDWAAESNQMTAIKWMLDQQPDLIISCNSRNQLWIQYLHPIERQISFAEKIFNYLAQKDILQTSPELLTTYVTCYHMLINLSSESIKTKCITAMKEVTAYLEKINVGDNSEYQLLKSSISGCKAAIHIAENNLREAATVLDGVFPISLPEKLFIATMCHSLGTCFETEKIYNEALRWYAGAFALCPASKPNLKTFILQDVIFNYVKQDNFYEAEAELQRLNNESVPSLLLAQINDSMACNFLNINALHKAEFYNQKAMQFCPSQASLEKRIFSCTMIQIYVIQGKFEYVSNLLKIISDPLSEIKTSRLAKAYVSTGNKFFNEQKYSEAESCWNMALQCCFVQTKLWLTIHYKLAQTCLMQGKIEEAQSLLKKANGCQIVSCPDLPSDLNLYKNSYLFVNNQQLYYVLEDGTKRNCYVSNLTQFRKAIEMERAPDAKVNVNLCISLISSIIASDKSDTKNSILIDMLYDLAELFFTFKQFPEARFYFEVMSHFNNEPKNLSNFYNTIFSARTYLAQGNIEQAKALLLNIDHEECAKIDFQLGSAYYRMAEEFLKIEHYKEAQFYFARALASCPDTEKSSIFSIRANLALTNLFQDNIKEAKNLLKLNSNEEPNIKEKVFATTYREIGDQFYKKNLYKEAQPSYQTALLFCPHSEKELQDEINKKLASTHVKLGKCYLYGVTLPANLSKAWECFMTADSANLSDEQRAELDSYLKFFVGAPTLTASSTKQTLPASSIQQIKRKMVRAIFFESCLTVFKINITLDGCELTLPADFSKTHRGFASEVTITLAYAELFKFIEIQAQQEKGICAPLNDFLNQLFIAKQEQLALEKLARLRSEYSELIAKVCVVYTRIKNLQHDSKINLLADYLHAARQYKPTDDKQKEKAQKRISSKINSLITRFTNYFDTFSEIFPDIEKNIFPNILDTFLTLKWYASKKLEAAMVAYKEKNFQKGDSLLVASTYENQVQNIKKTLEELIKIEKKLSSELLLMDAAMKDFNDLKIRKESPSSSVPKVAFPLMPCWEQYIQAEELKDITDRAARYQEVTQRTIVEIQTATGNEIKKNENMAATQTETEENEESTELAIPSDTHTKAHEACSQSAATQPKNPEEQCSLADASAHALLHAPLTALISPARDEAGGAAASSKSHSHYSYYFSQPKYHAKAFELSASKLEETTKQVEYIYHQFLKANDHDKTILTYALLTHLLSLIEDFKRQNNNAFPESVANKIRNFFYHSERDITHTLMPQYYQAATQLINYLRDTKLPPDPRGINELRNMIGEGFLKEILLFKETEARNSETLAAKIKTLHTEMDFTQSEIDDQDIKDAASRFMQGLSGALQAKLKERDFELYTKDFQQKEHKQARELGAQYRHTGFSIFQRERDSSAAAAAAANTFYKDSESTAAPHP